MGKRACRATGAAVIALAVAGPVVAQAAPAPGDAVPAPADPLGTGPVDFSADTLSYDEAADRLTAEGRVRMLRDGHALAADRVVWERKSGRVVASGNVVLRRANGDRLVGERIELGDDFREQAVDQFLVLLEGGGRLAAERATRADGQLRLQRVAYTGCPVTGPDGCARRPSWKVVAAEVIRDEAKRQLRFRGARLEILGVTLPVLPVVAVGDGTQDSGLTGALVPRLGVSGRNGVEVSLPWHWQLGRNRDATVTAHLFTGAAPALEARYRQLGTKGALQVTGFLTSGPIDTIDLRDTVGERGLRVYAEANGRWQLDPRWSVTAALRAASDRTLARRYDLSRDSRFRNLVEAERIDHDSYVSIAGWAFQGLRVDDVQGQMPIVLPAIDARWRRADPWLGGRIELQANSLAVVRTAGQDTARAFAGARWDLRRLTRNGQELLLTGYARGDLYHSRDSALTRVPLYRGRDGWQARAIVAGAAEWRWPLIGAIWGGTQRLTPRVQIVASPRTPNLRIPNEDARAVDLEDSNLFALNRFPGHDRWEDGSRVTYGLDWQFDRPGWSIATVIGQSYRLASRAAIFPDGTGLNGRFSDIVGRTRLRVGRRIDITHRFRLDKNDLTPRRSELDLTVGSDRSYVQLGYLRLDRDIDPAVEDLRNKEELRLAGRWQFRPRWAIFGSTVVDLTDRREDPLSQADGFTPVRYRLGLTYEDECLELGVRWKRDYERLGTFRSGSSIAFTIALKGFGGPIGR